MLALTAFSLRNLLVFSSSSQLWLILTLRGLLTMSGDSFDRHDWEGVLLASGGQRTRMLLNPCNAQDSPPQQRVIQLKMSVVLRLRNSGMFLGLSSKLAAINTFSTTLADYFCFLIEEYLTECSVSENCTSHTSFSSGHSNQRVIFNSPWPKKSLLGWNPNKKQTSPWIKSVLP